MTHGIDKITAPTGIDKGDYSMSSELKMRNIPFSPPDITELEISEVVEALKS